MKILIIDNTIDPNCWGSKSLCDLARLAPNATVCVRRAPQGDLPKNPQDFDRIIVSGSKTSALDDSPWVGQLIDFIKRSLDRKRAFLGVCYGHQVLARSIGGKEVVGKAAKPEFGWTKIHVTATAPILEGLPPTFYSFSSHFEEVQQLPKSMKILANSEDCAIQACQLDQLPVYGVQFHPEKTIAEAKQTFSESKKSKTPVALLHPSKSEELYDPKVGEMIFKNFLQLEQSS
jgi:GMP synthase (glutamine-hydrolysing)